ncbi:hypothetical protein TeGR_g767 [Tetraparma gracilis]|uniref:VTC domain-containing protein n=1 Tax=Tetraparma gracilis TaxID=2962635 RepID=A0ABQ6MUB3_9STRA|nr:hypothetical protein TeGR_g767 [Tetraparma gracilis]
MSDPPNPPGRRKSFSDRKAVKSEVFERKSLKFWVPTHRVPAVIEIVKKFVPVRRRGVIHSVYLDDAESSMYNARLVRAEGSQLLRYRWYDDDEPRKEVFVEVKTHRNKVSSMKERFVLSPENATKFETGDAGVVENLSENAAALASSAGALLREKGLRRVLRTEYYRTAFEDPSHADYRASLDQNVTLVKE